jgi:hypothetical protein
MSDPTYFFKARLTGTFEQFAINIIKIFLILWQLIISVFKNKDIPAEFTTDRDGFTQNYFHMKHQSVTDSVSCGYFAIGYLIELYKQINPSDVSSNTTNANPSKTIIEVVESAVSSKPPISPEETKTNTDELVNLMDQLLKRTGDSSDSTDQNTSETTNKESLNAIKAKYSDTTKPPSENTSSTQQDIGKIHALSLFKNASKSDKLAEEYIQPKA